MATLETLPFDNRYIHLPEDFYARVPPRPLPRPRLVAVNPDAAALLGLGPEQLARPEFAEYFSGARPLPGADPIAAVYAGHQFGNWVPQLGDGRALLLGEVVGPDGRRWDLHLKGAGQTPFSRRGDGRAVLRSVIREYLCSEAMHGLGVPTTRALCIIGGDEPVVRERVEPGAMMVRLAPSHVRFGTFQVFAARKRVDHLRLLADHVIAHHYPELAGTADAHPALLAAIARRTGNLVADWQANGFVHGVLNSDNMSALGLTIDYGPFAFIDHYRHDYVRNHTDHTGFYAYNRQPQIGRFNVYLLATAMLPLMTPEAAQAGLDAYQPAFDAAHAARLRAKLGLATAQPDDAELAGGLFELMDQGGADFSAFFRALAGYDGAGPVPAACTTLLEPGAHGLAAAWFARYGERLRREKANPAERRRAMDRVNPLYVLRTHLLQAAIDAAEAGDHAEIGRLHDLSRDPFTERPGMAAYAAPPARDQAMPLLSCSS
ncbi:MAG: YdiU family protein [Nitrospirae bacterium]|nr:YdiU family protein [Nitrospirota bacterium]